LPTPPPTDEGVTPRVAATSQDVRAAVEAARRSGRSIGLVPTMGALHAGHISLVEATRRECGFTVVSIFVNPMQFGPKEDFSLYPRPFAADLARLAECNVDLVFAPATEEVYRPGHGTTVDVGPIAEPLEGRCRPGHFRGVATVVLKLFNVVAPDRAYFGQKDYQQTLVIRKLAADLDLPIDVAVCPTVREPDGLALSSRNVYLSPQARQKALVLSQGLRLATDAVAAGERDAGRIVARARALFQQAGIDWEYFAIADRDTLAEVVLIDRPVVALVAARVDGTRLIDNVLIDV
jgi:pantoate--beta-alanine ligase